MVNTIKDAVEELQRSIQAVIPDMQVAVNISIAPHYVEQAPDKKDHKKKEQAKKEMPADLVHDIDMAALRKTLNAYVKQVGADKAIALVSKYTGGSKNAADIPADKYVDLVQEIVKEFPEMALTFENSEDA